MFTEPIADIIALLVLFVVRVGIPIALTLALGYWLEKKLQPAKEEHERSPIQFTRRERAGKIVQLHCWDLYRCEPSKRAQCAAFQHPELPCWLALQVEGGKVYQGCFTCRLYKTDAAAA